MKKHFNRETASDTLFVLGGVSVAIGAGILHVAAGLICGGILAMFIGWAISRGDDT